MSSKKSYLSKATISFSLEQKDKDRIVNYAKKCGLSVSEYMLQISKNSIPKENPPAQFFNFRSSLDDLYSLCQGQITEDTEKSLHDLITDLDKYYLLPDKKKPLI
jgi:replication initiation and membrane attachment protein DnaB